MGKLGLVKALHRRGWRLGGVIAALGFGFCVAPAPAHSAEEIIISYGIIERTIAIEDLEAFAAGERLSRQLSEYARNLGLTDEELNTLQAALTQRANISQVDVAQFLYTIQGKALLRFIGDVVQTPSRQSGFYAIRAGLILAAADRNEGLTVINFLKKYPTPSIRIDIGRGLEIAESVTDTLGDSERAISLVQSLAAEATDEPPQLDLDEVSQLVFSLPQFEVIEQTIQLLSRDREVEGTLFLPTQRSPGSRTQERFPVVVISHGLGDERQSYRYLAIFLAQRGFAVATLDHPGSDRTQISQLLSGFSPDLIDNREFLDRPAEISALLDEIQQFADSSDEFRGRLDTDNVGVIGQSFGGYTALALAGAEYNVDTLQSACEPEPNFLNPSLLLQCQAIAVAPEVTTLRDDRVKAIIAINPIGSAIFGPSGFSKIDIPTLIMAATADTVAPALPEQIAPFTWLENDDRYLVLASGTTHFSVIDSDPEAAPSIPVPAPLLGDDPELAQDYLQIFSLAFFQRYLKQNLQYEAALTAEFAETAIAQSPLQPLSLIQNLQTDLLEQVVNGAAVVSDRE